MNDHLYEFVLVEGDQCRKVFGGMLIAENLREATSLAENRCTDYLSEQHADYKPRFIGVREFGIAESFFYRSPD